MQLCKFLIVFSLLFTFPLSAQDIIVKHLKGTNIFKSVPKRVVVLGNGSLDVLDNLGITPVGTPHSLLPEHLQKYRLSTENTGTVAEPNFETIFTLKPDVIIAENRMLTLHDKLNQIAPTVMFYVDSAQYWSDTKKNWRMLGSLFSKQNEIEAFITQTQVKIDSVAHHNKNIQLKALALMNNGNSVAMFNKGSRFSLIFDEFGFAEASSNNIAPIKGHHGNLVSFEYIADAKPQVMFVMDRQQAIGKSSGKAKILFDNPLVYSTPASQNCKLIFINSNAWYITAGGITATQMMIEDVKKVFSSPCN